MEQHNPLTRPTDYTEHGGPITLPSERPTAVDMTLQNVTFNDAHRGPRGGFVIDVTQRGTGRIIGYIHTELTFKAGHPVVYYGVYNVMGEAVSDELTLADAVDSVIAGTVAPKGR